MGTLEGTWHEVGGEQAAVFVLAAATVPVPHREILTDAGPTRGRLLFGKEYHSVET